MKVLKFIKSRKTVAVLLIILSITTAISLSTIFWNQSDMQSSFIEFLYFATQIVSSIFVTSGVIIAVWQYYLTCQSTKTNLEMIQVQQAIKLSEYYKDNILVYLPAVRYIYDNSGLMEIVSKIDVTSIQHFDEAEFTKQLSEEDRRKLTEITESDKFFSVFLKANEIYNLGLHNTNFEVNPEKTSEEEQRHFSAIERQMLSAFIGHLFCSILNNAEYFAMHFSHRTADETVIFESLHQTYLESIQLLYFKIAKMNTTSACKYYTNVIWLYDKWRTRKEENEKDFIDGVRNLRSVGTIIQN